MNRHDTSDSLRAFTLLRGPFSHTLPMPRPAACAHQKNKYTNGQHNLVMRRTPNSATSSMSLDCSKSSGHANTPAKALVKKKKTLPTPLPLHLQAKQLNPALLFLKQYEDLKWMKKDTAEVASIVDASCFVGTVCS